MTCRTGGRLALLLSGAALAAPAHAATVVVDRPCYLPGETVRAAGTGFQPGAAYRAFVNGTVIGGGTVDSAGSFAGRVIAPEASDDGRSRSFTLTATDPSGVSAATVFAVAEPHMSFSPTIGNPRSLHVRFRGNGFFSAAGPARAVYAHYVDPRGRHRKTVSLGAATGSCGKLRTHRRKLFPVAPRSGTWRLQFDAVRRYKRTTVPRFTIELKLRRAYR